MSRYRNALLFVGLSLAWGGTFPAVEVGLRTYPPVLLAAYRFYVGAALLVAVAVVRESDPWPRTRGDALAVVASGGLFVAAGNAFLFVGQQYTTGSVASIVYGLNPIMTAAFAAAFIGGAGLDVRDAVGVLVGLVGVGLVARPDPATLVNDFTGVGLVFVAVVSVALGSVLVRRFETTCSPLALTAWAAVLGAVALHAASRGLGEPATLVAPLLPLAALAFLGTVSSAGGYLAYFTLLDRVGPFQANLISYTAPVVATITGWALLGEPVTQLTVLGFLAVFAGFLIVKRRAVAAELPKLRALL